MQATLTIQAAPAARVQARRQQVACSAAPMQQRAVSVVAPKVGGLASQRNVAAHAKGAIKPMEATFTEFKLVDKSKKVRGSGRRAPAAVPPAAAARSPRCRSGAAQPNRRRLARLAACAAGPLPAHCCRLSLLPARACPASPASPACLPLPSTPAC